MNEYLTVREIAKIYNIHEETARRWCQSGKIEAKRIGRSWYIKRDGHIQDEQ